MIFLKKISRRLRETTFLLAETGGKWYTIVSMQEDGGIKMDRIPKPGEFYRHFKNNMYQIVAVASHSETGEQLVIYQALYGDYGIYARPLDNFLSSVDREKYPDAEQEFRFERTEPGRQEKEKEPGKDARKQKPQEEMSEQSVETKVPDQPNPFLIEFLDAESTEEQLAVLRRMEGCVGKRELDSICVYLDISTRYGSLEEQIEGIRRYLKLQMHYDASRLRRDKRDDSSCFI